MDTTTEYIEMFTKAFELHDLWHMRNGDFYYKQNRDNAKEFCVSIWEFGALKRCKTTKGKTWLPRQDQLQKMIGEWSVAYSLFDFWKHKPLYFIDSRPYYPFNVFHSLEQCWLAFVMHEKHGKHWDGSDWKS